MDKRPLKVYVAAPWTSKQEALVIGTNLAAMPGVIVTSRWLYLDDKTERGPEQLAKEAAHDFEDVVRADCVILLNFSKSEGKAVEQGIALAQGIPIIVVGTEHTNVFQYLPSFHFVKDIEEAVRVAKQLCHKG